MTSSRPRLAVVGGALALLLTWVPMPAAGQDLAPVNHALIFGINQYRDKINGVPELKYAVPDARELREALEDQNWDARGFFNVDVNRRTIVEELTRLAGAARQQDTVLIYFAGHGVRDQVGRQHTYWLTYPSKLSDLAVESIRLSHLLDYVQDIPADRKIVLLDHCDSGDVERVGVGNDGGTRNGTSELSLAPAQSRDLFAQGDETPVLRGDDAGGIVILGSARDAAYEFEEIGHGLFTHGLLQALRAADTDTDGDRKLSLSEVWGRAQNEMSKVKRDLPAAAGITQVPVEILIGSGLMGWKLFDAAVAPSVEAEGLRDVVNRLEQETDFGSIDGGLAQARTLQALLDWEASILEGVSPEVDAQAIVDKLKQIRDLDSAISWEAKKQMLVSKLQQRGMIPDGN